MSRHFKLSYSLVLVVLMLPLVVKAEISLPKTTEVVLEEVKDYLVLDGQVEAVNKSTVSAQTSGVISKLVYDVGDYVEKGSLLARISSEIQKSSLQEAKAKVNEARAAINSASAAVAQAEAALREAQANYAVARSEFNRVRGLFAKKILTKSQYDQAEANLKSASARVESAKASLKAAKARLTAARSAYLAAKAGLAKAGEQLGYTEVVAPYSGIVTDRHVELGEVVTAGSPIMTGISLKELRVVTYVPQRSILKVRKYNSARIYLDNDKIGFAASKLTIFPYADSLSHAFKVRATLKTAPKGLFPGVFVKTGFEIGKEKHLVVPATAIAYRSEVTGVYVMDDDNMPHFRQIRVGKYVSGDKIRVLSGLEAGEKVALDPVHAAVFLKQKVLEAAGSEGKSS